MHLTPTLTSAPAELPVTLAEFKAHSRIDFDDDNTLLTSLLTAAVAHLDGYSGVLGRCLITQTWTQLYQTWDSEMLLPFPGVSSVVVSYQDSDDAAQTVSSATYELLESSRRSVVRFKSTFTSPALEPDTYAPISIALTAGYGAAAAVPVPLKTAIVMLASHWYEHREAAMPNGSAVPVPFGFHDLIAPYRGAYR